MAARNDIHFLLSIYKKFAQAGIKTFIFGGWAEEMLGLISPRQHEDIDFLYLAEDFTKVDQFIKANDDLAEIIEKRFPHKRAFEVNGTRVEIFLVNEINGKYQTIFFGKHKFIWPDDTFGHSRESKDLPFDIASPASLLKYRKYHSRIMNQSKS